MKVIIQCAGLKQSPPNRLRDQTGREVYFVAQPDHPGVPGGTRCCHPDNEVAVGEGIWRDAVAAYNRGAENPYHLRRAADLYRPRVYRELVDGFGWEHVFVLSAGWGLIRSDFLLPDYNVTFCCQKKVPVWARRTRNGREWKDFNHLLQADIGADEPLHFFGGQAYLPMFCTMISQVAGRKIAHYKGHHPACAGVFFEPFIGHRNQNWHYDAALEFLRTFRNKPGPAV